MRTPTHLLQQRRKHPSDFPQAEMEKIWFLYYLAEELKEYTPQRALRSSIFYAIVIFGAGYLLSLPTWTLPLAGMLSLTLALRGFQRSHQAHLRLKNYYQAVTRLTQHY